MIDQEHKSVNSASGLDMRHGPGPELMSERFVLDVEKDRLKSAPGFDKDKWPNMADQAWAKDIHTYYGSSPYFDIPRV